MNSVGAYRQGDVDAIVDDERDAGRRRDRSDPLGQPAVRRALELLAAELEHIYSALDRGANTGQELEAVHVDARRRDEVEAAERRLGADNGADLGGDESLRFGARRGNVRAPRQRRSQRGRVATTAAM